MGKKDSIFKRIKLILTSNPVIIWAMAWVSFMPSIGSFFFINHLYNNTEKLRMVDVLDFNVLFPFLIISASVMGLALMPTTLVAIITGFLFGWEAFPILAVAYLFATAIGYLLGKRLDHNSLEILLEKYPKARQVIAEKQDQVSQLIFFVRISPIIPFALSNLLFALLRADLKKVIWVGFLGMLPRTLLAFTTGIMAKSMLEAFREGNNLYQMLIFFALLLLSIWGITKVVLNFVKASK
ncbi:TVP38/TMEM64 family protein [Litoribacter ruber]|nr:VTT domain-containing protein [Litoribacter alkaliphilus]